jgi:hypothetical protein
MKKILASEHFKGIIIYPLKNYKKKFCNSISKNKDMKNGLLNQPG